MRYTMIQNQDISLLSQQAQTPKINRSPQSARSLASSDAQSKLQQKIETMAKSLSQVPNVNTSKSMEILKNIQKERERYSQQERNSYRALLEDVNSIEKSVLSFDRDRLMKNSQQKIAQQEVFRAIAQCEGEFRRIRQDNHEKLSEFSEKISSLKVEMVQKQSQNREKITRLQRQSQQKLIALERDANPNNSLVDFFQKYKKEFRSLRAAIEQNTRSVEKEITKNEAKILVARNQWHKKVEDQRNKQKISFQRNYEALEQIFKLMSQE